MAKFATAGSTKRIVLVTTTFYKGTPATNVRYALALEFCAECAKHMIACIMVDASPDEAVRAALAAAGGGYVRVVQQTAKGPSKFCRTLRRKRCVCTATAWMLIAARCSAIP